MNLKQANKIGGCNMKNWLLVSVIIVITSLTCSPMLQVPKGSVITVRETDALLGPDWSHKLVAILPPGTELTLIRMANDWYEVQLMDGSIAYVYKNNVEIIPLGDLVVTKTANIRTGPGNEFSILLTVQPGTKVTKLERQYDWVRVALRDGRVGWIYSQLVAGL
jgi:N-acetylmuramoyl-L-alanine amidase